MVVVVMVLTQRREAREMGSLLLLLLLGAPCGCVGGGGGLDVAVAANGSYSVTLDGAVWFASAPPFVLEFADFRT